MKNTTQNLIKVTRKSMLSLVCAASLSAVLTSGIAYAAENNTSDTFSESSADSVIGADAAQNFAFADAGIDPISATSLFTEYDYEDGQFVYEVDFTTDSMKYEYQIQAYDGSVLKKTVEYTSLITSLYTTADSEVSLSLDDAKLLAQNDAALLEKGAEDTADNAAENTTGEGSGSTESNASEEVFSVTFTKVEADYDDGLSVYDIEFYTDNAEYEYEISATSGDILSFSMELLPSAAAETTDAATQTAETADGTAETTEAAETADGTVETTEPAKTTGADNTVGTTYISVDEAKTIALERAGVSASDVTFKKAKLDKEDGIMVYEIEFYQGQMEYECTVNASTGAIVEFESEWDD